MSKWIEELEDALKGGVAICIGNTWIRPCLSNVVDLQPANDAIALVVPSAAISEESSSCC